MNRPGVRAESPAPFQGGQKGCEDGFTFSAGGTQQAADFFTGQQGRYRELLRGDPQYSAIEGQPGYYCVRLKLDRNGQGNDNVPIVRADPLKNEVGTLIPDVAAAQPVSGGEWNVVNIVAGVEVVAAIALLGAGVWVWRTSEKAKAILSSAKSNNARAQQARDEQENLTLEQVRAHQEAVQTNARNEVARKLLFKFLNAAAIRLHRNGEVMSVKGQEITDFLRQLGSPADWKRKLDTTHYIAIQSMLSETAAFLKTSGTASETEATEFDHQAGRVREPANPQTP